MGIPTRLGTSFEQTSELRAGGGGGPAGAVLVDGWGPAGRRPDLGAFERAEELAHTGTWEWNVETDELRWSDNMFRLLGVQPGSVTPSPAYVLEQVHPDDRGMVERKLDLAREEKGLPDPTYRVIWPDGTIHVLRSYAAAAHGVGVKPSRLVGAVQDVTALCELEHSTAESLTLMQTLESGTPVGFAFVDRELRIVRINATLAAVNGASVAEHIGRTVQEMVPDIWGQMEDVYREVLASGRAAANIEVVRYTPDERASSVWLASFYPVWLDGEVEGVGVIVNDITERRRSEEFSSALLDTMMEGLYALDADGRVTLMNPAASKMLGWEPEELLGKRMHGVIHFQRADGTPFPEEECDLFRVRLEGRPVRMTHDSFTRKDGAIIPVAYTAAPLMSGSNVTGVVVVFRDRSDEQAEEDRARRELDALAWVGRIRDALDQDKLVLYSQPIVPLDGGVPSQELLLRMRGQNGQMILPGSFLPVAEHYGQIVEIDRWVIAQALRLAATGQRVAANLSAASVSQADLLPLIQRELRSSGADPANVVFEITETALMNNLEAGQAFACGLVELGFKLALDDFGTGFGSFTYLKTVPVSFLKIDQDFVRNLRTSSANQHLVRAIVGLAEGFGYQTIAEGVEDAQTQALLAAYGVDYVQGFHTGRPAPITTSQA